MKLPKIMTASFEESLALLDDSLITYIVKDVEKPGVRDKPTLLRFIAILFVTLLFWFSKSISYLISHPDSGSPVPQPKINFFSIKIFYLMLIIFLFIWVITLIMRTKNTKYFFGYINVTNYVRWLTIATNLFFLTFFFSSLTILGVIIFFALVTIIGYLVARSKLRALSQQLFQTAQINNKLDDLMDKLIKFLMKYGWVAVILVVLWKFIFPGTTGVRTDFIGFISILAMWFTMDIGIVVAECYLFLPYLLYGYYKYKYPEDYRIWEEKTQIEWYGKKYFDKHIKGTTLEEKGEKQK